MRLQASPHRSGTAPAAWLTGGRRAWRLLVGVAVAVGLGAWLLRHAQLAPVLDAAHRLPAWAWPLAVAGLLGGHLLRARRLQIEWRHRRAVGLLACWRLVLLHNAAVLLLPLRTGEAGYLWLAHRQWGVAWRDAALSLLWWRIQDAAALALWALVLVPPWSDAARAVLALALSVALGALWAPLQARWLPRRWRRAPADPQLGWWCSVANWGLKLLVGGLLLAWLAGPQALPSRALALRAALGGELAGVQPLQGVAGLGSVEAGIWLGAGAPQPAGALLAAALAVHALSLAVALGAAALAQLSTVRRTAPDAQALHPSAQG